VIHQGFLSDPFEDLSLQDIFQGSDRAYRKGLQGFDRACLKGLQGFDCACLKGLQGFDCESFEPFRPVP
jgi:hypothetical protein